MFTMVNQGTRQWVSGMAAVAVVAFGGLSLDQGHRGAAPEGIVEVGEMTPINLMALAAVDLPEIVITAEAVAPGEIRAARRDRTQWLDGNALKATGAPDASVLLK